MKALIQILRGLKYLLITAVVSLGFAAIMVAPAVLMDQFDDQFVWLYTFHITWFIWCIGDDSESKKKYSD